MIILYYISIGFLSLSCIPQLIHGYRTEKLQDISCTTLVFVCISSVLSTIYFKIEHSLQFYIYLFISINVLILIFMQMIFNYRRLKQHEKMILDSII